MNSLILVLWVAVLFGSFRLAVFLLKKVGLY